MARWRGGRGVWVLAAAVVLVLLAGLAARHADLAGRGWQAVMSHREMLAGLVARHRALAMLGVGAAYALAVSLSLPVGLWFSLLDGLLFGVAGGTVVTVLASSLGAVVVFAVVRRLVGDRLGGKRVGALADELRRDGVFLLLSVRLMPIFPFWLVNLAAGAAGMRLAPYVLATVLGCVPISLVLSAIGAGLGADLQSTAPPSAGMLLRPGILLPLLALAALSASPVLWRRLRRNPRLP